MNFGDALATMMHEYKLWCKASYVAIQKVEIRTIRVWNSTKLHMQKVDIGNKCSNFPLQ
jgi:hypothetical protein